MCWSGLEAISAKFQISGLIEPIASRTLCPVPWEPCLWPCPNPCWLSDFKELAQASGEMTQQEKALAAKPDNLPVPGAHTAEGEN